MKFFYQREKEGASRRFSSSNLPRNETGTIGLRRFSLAAVSVM